MTPQKPPFLFGYWRPWNENSSVADSYLDYIKDTSLVKYGADMVGKYIQTASKEQVEVINKVGTDICQGLNALAYLAKDNTKQTVSALENLEKSVQVEFANTINELKFINKNLDIQIEQQRLSNLLLTNISELLRVPDSEKERQNCIELGIKFFVNAQKNAELYDDALEELQKAEALMKQDYFVLHRIGCIYLYVEKYIDLDEAIGYFLRAGKYASIESDPKAIRLANVLINNNSNSESNASLNTIKLLAADSYEKAAFASYVKGNVEDAIKFQDIAADLTGSPQNYFILAKYLARNDNIEGSMLHLFKAIEKDPNLAVAVFSEIDLFSKKEIVYWLDEKNKEIDRKITKLVNDYSKYGSNRLKVVCNNLTKLKSKLYSSKVLELDNLIYEANICIDEIRRSRSLFIELRENLDAIIGDKKRSEAFLARIESFDQLNLEQINQGINFMNDELTKVREQNTIESNIKHEVIKKKNTIKNVIYNIESNLIDPNELIFSYLNELKMLLDEEPSQSVLDRINFALKKSKDINKTLFPPTANEKRALASKPNLDNKPLNQELNENKKCFIATAAIGDEDHDIVKDYRTFRDVVLRKNLLGSRFIYFYYKLSPPIANIIERNVNLRFVTAYFVIKPLHRIIKKCLI